MLLLRHNTAHPDNHEIKLPAQPSRVCTRSGLTRTMKRPTAGALHAVDQLALQNFDVLPAIARVRLPVVAALFGISPVTVWRWCKRGQLPHPAKEHGITFWRVGELRDRLRTQGDSRTADEVARLTGNATKNEASDQDSPDGRSRAPLPPDPNGT